MWSCTLFFLVLEAAKASYPNFEPSHRMRVLLLPADMRVGSVIYRLRATDPDVDYPLRFDVADAVGRSIIRIDSLPCTATHTYCQGNVYLIRRLEPDRVYDMILSVRDSTGQETKVDATIKATRATSHFEDVFPYVPSLLMVPEDTSLGANLGFVLARKSLPYDRGEFPRGSRRFTELEMWGSEKFRLYQTTGTRDLVNASIKLTSELDFEERTMYMLTIFALDPWTVERDDTRNIAGFQLPVVVTDVQDMPPVFTSLPPVTTLEPGLQVGDKILQVVAQDGDRGNSRQVRYGLVSEKNPFTTFFNISERTGEIILAKPLKELHMITRASQPILLTIMAEEVKLDIHEPPALTATASIALIWSGRITNSPPKFMNNEYFARLKENAPQGTALAFGASYNTVVEDLDAGPDGVFALGLARDNGTFEVSPNVAEARANFVIRVRNNALLDFEKRTSVSFQLVASELGPGSNGANTTSSVVIYIEDENDNSPVFKQTRYQTQLPENVTADTLVAQVSATDSDSGLFGRIAYTRILGYLNHSLILDSSTGVILIATNNHGFDREAAAEYRFAVEAADMEGAGNKATVPLVIKILDVNDETPEFERQVFEFILEPGLRNFTSRAFVKAVDKDAEPPNNIVRYEIMSGNVENKFHLNEITGELSIRGRLGTRRGALRSEPKEEWEEIQASVPPIEKNAPFRRERQDDYDDFSSRSEDVLDSVIVLNVRAYDLGIPHRWQRAHVRIYPPESRARTMNFIVPGTRPDVRATEELLRALTGGRVTVQEVRPYTGREHGTDLTSNDSHQEKSVVTATVIYEGNSVVDLQQVEKRLSANKTQALVEQSVLVYKSENRVLFWLLIFLLILVTIAALLLLLCCLWQGCLVCPCIEVRKRKTSPSENMQFIRKERGTETKGVQVMYSARKEAWSAKPEDRLSYYPIRQDRDSVVLTPGRPSRHPTMLIEDVEWQNWEDHQRRHDIARRGTPYRVPSPSRHVARVAEALIAHERDYRHDHGELSAGRGEVSCQRGNAVSPIKKPHPSDYGDEIIYREGEIDKPMDDAEAAEAEILNIGVRTPPQNNLNPDSDSLRRHEVERGSQAREWDGVEDEVLDRDQLYIRDGNAEILRLLTRGPREDRPHTLVQESGKEILMQRFMEDQNGETIRAYLTQEYLSRLLQPEAQPMQDTQSLPGHMESSTQTECEAATQTDEPALLLPAQRNARSDNELSDDEDKPGRWRRGRRPNIKTPIVEEGESIISGESAHAQKSTRPAMFPLPESAATNVSVPTYTENKSSILRRRKLREKEDESSGDEGDFSGPSRPSRTRERKKHPNTVQIRADSLNRLYRALKDLQRAGSLNELTHSEDEPDRSYLKKAGFYRKIKELSTTTATNTASSGVEEPKQSKSKYMDWYKNLSTKQPKKNAPTKRKEDDLDSGIALSSLLGSKKSKLEKKSVFTIAYDDVQTNNIRPDTDSSQKL